MADCNLVITPTPVAYNIYGAKASNKFKEMISMYKTMHNLKNRSKDKKGFTLAELLIVVAIIAVLVAIAIPIFSNQLEKAREATDAANLRAAYAIAATQALADESETIVAGSTEVTITQTEAGWDYVDEIAGVPLTSGAIATVVEGNTVKVTVDPSGKPSFAVTP